MSIPASWDADVLLSISPHARRCVKHSPAIRNAGRADTIRKLNGELRVAAVSQAVYRYTPVHVGK